MTERGLDFFIKLGENRYREICGLRRYFTGQLRDSFFNADLGTVPCGVMLSSYFHKGELL